VKKGWPPPRRTTTTPPPPCLHYEEKSLDLREMEKAKTRKRSEGNFC
jgi:hypothetical protein